MLRHVGGNGNPAPCPGDRRGLTSARMNRIHDPRRRVPWIALLAGVALAGGLATAWWLSRPPRPTAPSSTTPEASAEPPLDAIHQRVLADADSAAIKSRWVDELPNVDLAGLDAARREIFVRFANAQRCTCGCGFTLAACRVYDPSCEVSAPLVAALLDSVRAGHIRSAAGIRPRPG